MIHRHLTCHLMKIICQNFVKPSLMENISCFDFEDIPNLLPVGEVFVGVECQSLLDSQSEDNINLLSNTVIHITLLINVLIFDF